VTVGDGLVTLNFPANPPERMEIAKHAWIGEMIGYVLGSTTDPGAIADIQYAPSDSSQFHKIFTNFKMNPLLTVLL